MLRTDISQQLAEEHRATSEQMRDPSVHSTTLIPAATRSRPDKRLVNLILIFSERVHGRRLRDHILNVFGGDLLNHLDEVVACPVKGFD